MTPIEKTRLVKGARTALRAQSLVMLIEEQGMHPERARIKLGVSERTSKRYRAAWGTWSANLWVGRGERPVQLHHVTATIAGGRIARSHKRIVPLAPRYHQHDHGKQSVERLGHARFFLVHGIDLLAEADRLWKETCNAG